MDIKSDLTKRQKEIFDFISGYASKHGYPPTVREIGKAVGLTSSSTVHAHLANLEKIGLLRRDPTKPRAIEVLIDKARRRSVGRACRSSGGRRGRADPRRGEHRGVRRGARGDRRARTPTTSCAVKGDSMRDAGILEGDYVVVKSSEQARTTARSWWRCWARRRP